MFGIMVGLGIYPTMASSCAEGLVAAVVLVEEGGDAGRGGHTLGRHFFPFLFSGPFLFLPGLHSCPPSLSLSSQLLSGEFCFTPFSTIKPSLSQPHGTKATMA